MSKSSKFVFLQLLGPFSLTAEKNYSTWHHELKPFVNGKCLKLDPAQCGACVPAKVNAFSQGNFCKHQNFSLKSYTIFWKIRRSSESWKTSFVRGVFPWKIKLSFSSLNSTNLTLLASKSAWIFGFRKNATNMNTAAKMRNHDITNCLWTIIFGYFKFRDGIEGYNCF